jgi:transposase
MTSNSFKLGRIEITTEQYEKIKDGRLDPWAYNRELYKKRNEIERLFRPLKGFRRFFS